MASREIHVQLNEPASAALEVLEASGADTAQAVNAALIIAADRRAQSEKLQAIATQVAADPIDRQEAAEIRAGMDGMHPAGGL